MGKNSTTRKRAQTAEVRMTTHETAIEALQRIAKHELECSERWAETRAELSALRAATETHAARWEKLAWLLIGSSLSALTATLFNLL